MQRSGDLPLLVVTGASGLVGRHLIRRAREHYEIVAVARRPLVRTGLDPHPHVHWYHLDLADESSVQTFGQRLRERRSPRAVVHLAAYYDYLYEDHPEYERTNVVGTRHLLQLARRLDAGRLIFTSSLAACRFRDPGEMLDERSDPDADHPYARSKRRGESLVRQAAEEGLPASILRLAAVFTDWCEYPPLHQLMTTWASQRWNARILAGRGRSAVSYIHVDDLVDAILRIVEESDRLPRCGVYLASPEGATDHRQLYHAATRLWFSRTRDPLLLPRALALPGVVIRDRLYRLVGRRPFEQPWMIRYVDLHLAADPARTFEELDWRPRPERHILARIPHCVAHRIGRPEEWHARNHALLSRSPARPHFAVAEFLRRQRASLTEGILSEEQAREATASPLPEAAVDETLRLLERSLRIGESAVFSGSLESRLARHAPEVDDLPTRIVKAVDRAIRTRRAGSRRDEHIPAAGRRAVYAILAAARKPDPGQAVDAGEDWQLQLL